MIQNIVVLTRKFLNRDFYDDENINDLSFLNNEDLENKKKSKDKNHSKRKNDKNIFLKYFQNVYKFLRSPSIVFIYDSVKNF